MRCNVTLHRFLSCFLPSHGRASLRRVTCRAVDARTLTLDPATLSPDQVVSGDPRVSAHALLESPDLEVGVWEHTAGVSTDVEADEVFIVLSGRATVEVVGGPTLELAPGTIGFLDAGSRTTWTVHETVRKVYVLR